MKYEIPGHAQFCLAVELEKQSFPKNEYDGDTPRMRKYYKILHEAYMLGLEDGVSLEEKERARIEARSYKRKRLVA